MRRLCIVYLLNALGVTAVQPFLPLWVRTAYLLGHRGVFDAALPAVIGGVLSVGGAAMAVGAPIFGWISDRASVRSGLLGALWGSGVGMLALAAWPPLWPLTLASAVQGLFQGGVRTGVVTMLARAAPDERRAPVLTLAILPPQVSWFLGPLIGTALTLTAGLHAMLLAMGLLALLAEPLTQLLLACGRSPETPVDVSA